MMCWRPICPANWYNRSLVCRVAGPVREEDLVVVDGGADGEADVDNNSFKFLVKNERKQCENRNNGPGKRTFERD